MNTDICILHANCQGEELESLLLASKSFTARYSLFRYANYTRDHIPEDVLSDCGLFLYQHLGPHWGELASEALFTRLPSGAARLRIPNMLFKGYWPFWTTASSMVFGDTFLDRLIDEGAPKAAILRIYLHRDISAFIDLEAALAQSLDIERKKEQDCVVKTVDFILEHWKDTPLFHTANHPGKELLIHTAQGLLDKLGLPRLTADEIARALDGNPFPSYSDFDLPIHPQIAAKQGLRFVRPGQTYEVYGRRMSFEQYISRYIDCRQNGYDEYFLGYLQLV